MEQACFTSSSSASGIGTEPHSSMITINDRELRASGNTKSEAPSSNAKRRLAVLLISRGSNIMGRIYDDRQNNSDRGSVNMIERCLSGTSVGNRDLNTIGDLNIAPA